MALKSPQDVKITSTRLSDRLQALFEDETVTAILKCQVTERAFYPFLIRANNIGRKLISGKSFVAANLQGTIMKLGVDICF